MKLIVLADCNQSNFEKLITVSEDKKSIYIDTQSCDEEYEYNYLLKQVNVFSQSQEELMLVKFSGKDSLVKKLGDECPEMIISLSYDKNSHYYVERPVELFLNILNIFK